MKIFKKICQVGFWITLLLSAWTTLIIAMQGMTLVSAKNIFTLAIITATLSMMFAFFGCIFILNPSGNDNVFTQKMFKTALFFLSIGALLCSGAIALSKVTSYIGLINIQVGTLLVSYIAQIACTGSFAKHWEDTRDKAAIELELDLDK